MSQEDKDTGCGRALRAWEAHLGGGAVPLARADLTSGVGQVAAHTK